MKLSAKQIERLVKQGEVVQTECKDASGGLPDSLLESYSAFANTDGGVILLGVKEVGGKFSITGVPNATALIKRFRGGVNNREKVSVNKAVAVEGGTSDARNSHIVNIFALVDIGERSGTGLSNLYALWGQHGFAAPVIREEFDPEKTIISISTGLDSNAKAPKAVLKSAQHRPKLARESAKGGSRSDQDPTKARPRPGQGPTKTRPIAWSDLPSSCRRVYEALKQDAFLTYRGMVAKLGLNKDTINTAIGTLVQQGYIRREGNKQTGHWEIVK